MKKSLVAVLCLFSASAFAQQFNQITKDDVEKVSKELGANFSHTTVSAPETNGTWGIEVGVLAGQTASPDFKDVINRSGGDGNDFKNVYHAGLFARGHFPYELFLELSILPSLDIEDATIKNQTFGLGWNFGSFFNWPLDVALGYNFSKGDLSFTQKEDTSTSPVTPAAKIDLETKTNVVWVGVSKTFAIVTPYLKFGRANLDSDLDASASIFAIGSQQSESVSESSSYFAGGFNLDLLALKLGFEAQRMFDTTRISGKLSLDF